MGRGSLLGKALEPEFHPHEHHVNYLMVYDLERVSIRKLRTLL